MGRKQSGGGRLFAAAPERSGELGRAVAAPIQPSSAFPAIQSAPTTHWQPVLEQTHQEWERAEFFEGGMA